MLMASISYKNLGHVLLESTYVYIQYIYLYEEIYHTYKQTTKVIRIWLKFWDFISLIIIWNITAFCAVERVEDAVKDENTNALFKALTSPVLGLKVSPSVLILDL